MVPETVTCQEIDARLAAARRKLNSVLVGCAHDFGGAFLLARQMPDCCFRLLIKVLTAPRYRRCGAIAHWLLETVIEEEKLTVEQRRRLLEVLVENHHLYRTEIARHAVGDLIARVSEPSVVIETIKRLLAFSRTESNHVAQVTAEVLLPNLDPGHSFHGEVARLFLTEAEYAARQGRSARKTV